MPARHLCYVQLYNPRHEQRIQQYQNSPVEVALHVIVVRLQRGDDGHGVFGRIKLRERFFDPAGFIIDYVNIRQDAAPGAA
jgi:hypothetical protein